MDELNKRVSNLENEIADILTRLDISGKASELGKLKALSQTPDFWSNSTSAQDIMKQISKLEDRIKPWQDIMAQTQEASDMLGLKDDGLEVELTAQVVQIEQKLDTLKEELKFTGPYDDHDAIVSIYAGAGGTDAQDWTQMLFRMYVRYSEKRGWKTEVIEESPGDEAGLKSVTLEVSGTNAYGQLKGEQGVHRLVRLSPFNADNLRQTSFSKVEIIPRIEASDNVEIDEKDLKVDVYRSGGHGGQSVNTTDSAVRITHLPTGITIAIQNERSQLQNRELAMTILRSKLAQLRIEQHQEKLSELKGPNQSAEWGNQIRSYVLHPYKQVKDLRTKHESSDPDTVLDGELDPFIQSYLEQNVGGSSE